MYSASSGRVHFLTLPALNCYRSEGCTLLLEPSLRGCSGSISLASSFFGLLTRRLTGYAIQPV